MDKPSFDWVCSTMAEWFDCPCNYGFGSTDPSEVIISEDEDWCEKNCGNVSFKECWKKFFEVLYEREKRNTL